MIDICERAKKLLEEAGFTNVSLKRLDETTGKEGIVIRPMPTTTVDRYYDRSRGEQYVYSITVRRRSERDAIDDCFKIAGLMRYASLDSGNGSYEFVEQEIYTEPQEQFLDEQNFYGWQVRIMATITRKV